MIPVTRPYLPERRKLDRYIDGLYDNARLTNGGPLVEELTQRLQEYLGLSNLLLVANGTLALQVAYRVLGLSGEVLTSPFSFVASASSLSWLGLKPVFADIDRATLNLCPHRAAAGIGPRTSAIVPVHVYGNPADCEAFERLAVDRGLKLVYDAAHAFGVRHRGSSVLRRGDASVLSLHATKLFHTVEGGAISFRDPALHHAAREMIHFGLSRGEAASEWVGINGKMSEFHAAMGLCVLDDIDFICEQRAMLWRRYRQGLNGWVGFQQRSPDREGPDSYAPVLFRSESELQRVVRRLQARGYQSRRYFHPSLDTLYGNGRCEHSRDVANRILCLPLYAGLDPQEVDRCIEAVKGALA